VARSRHQARERHALLDPNGIIAMTLAHAPLRAMDVGDAVHDLERIGDRTGARDVDEHDLPAEFDLPNG